MSDNKFRYGNKGNMFYFETSEAFEQFPGSQPDGYRIQAPPESYPCFGVEQVLDWRYEESHLFYLYQDDLIEMDFLLDTDKNKTTSYGLPEQAVNATHTDCRDIDGITVGIVDGIITFLRLLSGRDMSPESVRQAVLDIANDKDFKQFLLSINLILKMDSLTKAQNGGM